MEPNRHVVHNADPPRGYVGGLRPARATAQRRVHLSVDEQAEIHRYSQEIDNLRAETELWRKECMAARVALVEMRKLMPTALGALHQRRAAI